MTKLEQQFPRAGQPCKFYLKDGSVFEGFFDHGGAYSKSSITSVKGSDHHFQQGATGSKDYDRIEGWDYIK